EPDAAPAGRRDTGNDVEQGGLARAVGTDHGVDGARSDIQRHVVDGHQAAERTAYTLDIKNEWGAHERLHRWLRRSKSPARPPGMKPTTRTMAAPRISSSMS